MATKSEIEREIESQAEERKQAIYQVRRYLKNPGRFSIFLMGERGTGKSYWVKQISEEMKKNKEKYHNKFVELNCSSLSKDLAESELFGYGKGVFTGQSEKGKLGKFLEVAGYKLDGRSGKVSKGSNGGGVLFLDEIHHLDDPIFAKLLSALQTDNQGKFIIKRLGDDEDYECEIRVVFGSNRSLEEIKKIPGDFFDRVFQLPVKLPSLKDTVKSKNQLEKEFESVFKRMDFTNEEYYPNVFKPAKEFYTWLYNEFQKTGFPGNYRDLENIAILWTEFSMQLFQNNMKANVREEKVIKKLNEHFKNFPSTQNFTEEEYDPNKPADYYFNKLKKEYARWALYESGIEHPKQNSDNFGNTNKTKKTLQDWLKKS